MKIQLDRPGSSNVIQSYAPGRITVNSIHYASSLILTPERVIENWPPTCFSEIEDKHMEMIVALSPEVAVLGTGRCLRFPARTVLRPFYVKGVGIEVMDTGAACRTYNVLMAEGRRVAAALLIIEE